MLAGSASINAAAPGFLEGYLKIVSLNEVEPAHEMPRQSVTAEVNTRYPLVILSRDGKKEIARVTADGNGNYRTALPPGDYVLDVQGWPRKHVRWRPQPFAVVSNQTVRGDMNIDTDHWRVRSTQSFRPDCDKRFLSHAVFSNEAVFPLRYCCG